MSETIYEQMEYGSTCVHGTSVGTPGGADLMCGWCESGFTHWVEDPLMQLQVRVLHRGKEISPWGKADTGMLGQAQWRVTSGWASGWGVVMDCVSACLWLGEALANHDVSAEWRVRQVEEGYWTDEIQAFSPAEADPPFCGCKACNDEMVS